MPLKWQRGRNPYVHNAFGVLRIGPATPLRQLHALAEKRKPKASAGLEGEAARAAEQAVDDAEKCLREPALRAEEQLLAHPQTHADGDRRRRLAQEIRKAASQQEAAPPLGLRSPAALYAFTPWPDASAVELPAWEALGLCAPGDAEDLALDIVFDR